MKYLRQRRPREHRAGHLSFIRTLPCVACLSNVGVQAAHIRAGSLWHAKVNAGIGAKPDDEWTLPLCQGCHVDGAQAQHKGNELAFWNRVGIDPFDLAQTLWRLTWKPEEAEQVIRLRRDTPITSAESNGS